MLKGQVTLKDIARELRVSVATVSRALRDSYEISPDTKKAVLELAAKWDYQPNSIALSLKRSKTNIIGIVIPEFVNSYFAYVTMEIQKIANQRGYRIMIAPSNESYQTEVENIQALISSRVDGLILSLTRETTEFTHIRNLQKKGFPIIFFNRISDEIEGTKVIVDDYNGAFKAVEHLIQMGCKKIAHIGGPDNLKISINRKQGYIDALKKHGLSIDESLIVQGGLLKEKTIACTKELLSRAQLPEGIFAINDPTAIEAMQCIKSKGLRIPEDIAIVGFSDDPYSAWLDPPLSSVSQPLQEIGEITARLLIEQIEGKRTIQETILLKTELVIRKSSMKIDLFPGG